MNNIRAYQPAISIIVPLFNKGRYIAETLHSVVCQTLSTWELLIVDNGSTDDGPTQVETLARQDSRVNLLSCAKRGPGAARNVGLHFATGSWCLFLDADDLIDENHLANLLQAADSHPDCNVVAGGWADFIDGQSPTVAVTRDVPRMGGLIRFATIAHAPWPISAAIVKRNAIVGDLIWDEDLDSFAGEDIGFWFRLLQFHDPVLCDNHGFRYRRFTHNSRTDACTLRTWLCGITQAHTANLDFLSRQRIPLCLKHAESLMRTYSSVWMRASNTGNHAVSEQALLAANIWLVDSFRRGGWRKPSLIARYVFGIPLCSRLSQTRARAESATS